MNDYNLPKLAGVISMTKFKNALKRDFPTLVPHLRNVRINGQTQGCSGFIQNPATGRLVYVTTDLNHGYSKRAMYRTAKNLRDFTGGMNHNCAFEDIVSESAEFLLNLPKEA